MLKTNRGFWKFFLLSIITFGIYSIVFWHMWGNDLNRIVEKDGDKPQISFVAAFFLGIITFGIVPLVWYIKMVVRVYGKAEKKGVEIKGSLVFFLIAEIVLSFTIVCPIIALIQLFKTMNNLCGWYNNNYKEVKVEEAPVEEAPAEEVKVEEVQE